MSVRSHASHADRNGASARTGPAVASQAGVVAQRPADDREELVAARMRGRIAAMQVTQGMKRSRSSSRVRVGSTADPSPVSEPRIAVVPLRSADVDPSDAAADESAADVHSHGQNKSSTKAVSRTSAARDDRHHHRREIQAAAIARLHQRGTSHTPIAAVSSYALPATHLPLPTIPASVTPRRVFEWFGRTLHVDLLGDRDLRVSWDQQSSESRAGHEQHADGESGDIPLPSVQSTFWTDLISRMRDGVLIARIASALSGEPLPGVQLNPKNHAAVQFNWRAALDSLRIAPDASSADGRQILLSPRRQPAAGDGVITFSLLFALTDVMQMHPATLWALLVSVFTEYSSIRSRSWSVQAVPDDASASRSTAFRSFVGPGALRPEPTRQASQERHNRHDSPSARTRRSESPARRAQSGKGRPETPCSARSARTSSTSPRAVTRRNASTPLARGRRSSSPAVAVADAIAASPLARSSSPLDFDRYQALQAMADDIEATHQQQEAHARARPIVFQPKNMMRHAWAEDVHPKTTHAQTRPVPSRPDHSGPFFGPRGTHAPTTTTSVTSIDFDWSEWPPSPHVSSTDEQLLRSWLADELNLFVLPSQEAAESPIHDPYRNGTLIADIANKFIERFGGGETTRVPIRRHPTHIMSVIENVVRALDAIQRMIRRRHRREEDPTQASTTSNDDAQPPFDTLLHSLSDRMEFVVDGIVKGDALLWGVLWHLHTEWSIGGKRDASAETTSNTTSDHNSGWSPTEVALLQFLQRIGVCVSVGVVEESLIDDLSAEFGSVASNAAAPSPTSARSVLPRWPQVGVRQFVTLFRKGVLLCDLVAATATDDSASLMRHVVRDPRTWRVCRANLSKGIAALSVRPRMSQHLLRNRTAETLDAIADGDRRTIMSVIYDIYACSTGEAPHSSHKECMGRAPGDKAASEAVARNQLVLRTQAHDTDAPATTKQIRFRSQPATESEIAPSGPEADASSLDSESKAISPSSPTALKSSAAIPLALQDGGVGSTVAAAPLVSKPLAPKVVQEAISLLEWIKSLGQKRGVRHAAARTLLPHHLLSVAELRSVGPRFHASLGFSSSPALDSSLASPFQDGLLLCGIVSQLQHAPLPGVVTTPTAHQQKSQASRRAVAMHNIETALNQLRKNQRMPLTYLYREAAQSIVHHDAAILRALLIDIRTAFPASCHLRKTSTRTRALERQS